MKRIRLEGFWSRLKDEAKNWKLSKGQKDEARSFVSVVLIGLVALSVISWFALPTVIITYLMWFA